LGTPDRLLDIDGLAVRYGKRRALEGVSFGIRRGEVVTLLGANGAGKTTVLNAICGFLPLSAGRVTLDGAAVQGMAPHVLVRRGISQVSQGRDLFGAMSVLDNLRLGRRPHQGPDDAALERIFATFPRLQERRAQRVSTLSGGEQQMVAIGRALMAAPRILLLDEPSAGLAPRFVHEIGVIMRGLRDAGATMLLVEQNLGLAADVADRFYILRDGRIVHEGGGEELRHDHRAFARTYYL
jgi:branched-chain amino acid transport system ATP-binding protein